MIYLYIGGGVLVYIFSIVMIVSVVSEHLDKSVNKALEIKLSDFPKYKITINSDKKFELFENEKVLFTSSNRDSVIQKLNDIQVINKRILDIMKGQ